MSKSFKIFLWVVAAYFVLIVIPLVYADGGVSIHEFWRHLGAAPIPILAAAYALVWNQRRNAERKNTAVSRMAAEIRAKREASRDDSVRELSRQRVTVVKEIAQSSPDRSRTDDQYDAFARKALAWYVTCFADQDAGPEERVRADRARERAKSFGREHLIGVVLEDLYRKKSRLPVPLRSPNDVLNKLQFPMLVIRIFPAIYQRERIQLRLGPPNLQLTSGRCLLQHPWPIDSDGRVTDECRTFLLQGVQDAVRSRGMRMCVVWAPQSCTYVEADAIIDSELPPSGGEPGFSLSSIT